MSDTKGTVGSKALQEFLSEAQDIAESLGKSLMLIDGMLKEGEPDPELVNDLFRGMHTLKSLSGMFEVKPLTMLAHHEENLLEEIRLGRIDLDSSMLDLFFESLELITRILAMIGEDGDVKAADHTEEVDALIRKIEGGEQPREAARGGTSYDPLHLFGPELLEVLTEYEEHRLRTNVERGLSFCRIHTLFDLDSIDVNLDAIKAKLKPVGEVITYLPSAEEGEPDKLGIDIIIALQKSFEDLEEALKDVDISIEEIVSKRLEKGKEEQPSGDEEELDDIEKLGITFSSIPAKGEPLAKKGDTKLLSLRSVSQTVRVDIRKLDHLMNVVGELAIVRNAIMRISEQIMAVVGRGDMAIELHRINRGFDRRLGELREGILEVRMVPLSQVFDRLARVVRKISRELKKRIHFVISGSDTEVDKLIIEELSDPLMHIVRNAIDHGVEEREARLAAGKPDFGTVALTAYQKGNHVVIEIEDDGAGINDKKLLAVSVDRKLIEPDQIENMTQNEIANLIFIPGVSTAEETTEISGRGVGMDVVKTNIAALGGVVEVQSEPGIGTKFSITLPVTLAIIPALLVVVAGQTYAVPLNTVAEALFVSREDIGSVLGTNTMTLRGQTLALCRLAGFFGAPDPGPIKGESCVVVASIGQRRLGLEVDAMIGQQEVVIKPLGKSLGKAHYFSGATDIGGDRLALVLDAAAVIEKFFSTADGSEYRSALSE